MNLTSPRNNVDDNIQSTGLCSIVCWPVRLEVLVCSILCWLISRSIYSDPARQVLVARPRPAPRGSGGAHAILKSPTGYSPPLLMTTFATGMGAYLSV